MENYVVRHSKNKENWQVFESSYKNNYVAMQYEYGIQTNNPSISERWNRFIEIKKGDRIFLQNSERIYAWGYAIEPCLKNELGITVSPVVSEAKKIVKNHDHGMYRSDKSKDYIIFSDCEVFYENLEDGKEGWGQRIDVDEWRSRYENGPKLEWNDLNKEGIEYKPIAGRAITKEITEAQAQKYIAELQELNKESK